MSRFPFYCCLWILAILQFNSVDAQKLTDEWRVIKKTRTETNGQKFLLEYTYANDGGIESVKYLTIGGAVNITISDFKFDRNRKPSSYIVTWNREGAKANVFLKYDNEGRVIEVKKVNDNRETTLFTYRYSEKEIFVVEQKSNTTSGNIKDNKITFYTEQGDYNETTSDAASQTITSVITLKQNNSVPKPYPENFMGGFGASNCFAEKNKYRLAPNEEGQSFYVHNFMATFRGADSYVVKDTFSLGTNILLNIPLVKDKSLNAGTIKVLQNKIIWNEYVGDVNVAIETWKIKGTGFSYDINQGGFKVIDALLQTNLPELPLKSLIITPTNLDPGKDNIDPSKDVTLAGVASLTLNNAVPTLVLEQSAPHDQKQHWRLNLYNTTNAPVAYLQNIPGIAADDKIAINLFSNYSDGKKTLSINGVAHTFFKVMQQNIENIEIGKDYFTLIGNTNLQIPGSNGNVTGRFKYMKKNDTITCTPEKLNTDVELAGNVSFTGGQSLKDYELRDGYFSAIGSAQIYEKSKSDGFALTSKIIKDDSGTKESVPTEPVIWIDKTEKTFGPRFIKAEIIDNVLNISWLNTEGDNIREYRLYKWQGRDFKVIENIDENINTIQVKNYTSGERNQYMLTAVNTKGVENKGTKPITVY
jgi:hypothetical protein